MATDILAVVKAALSSQSVNQISALLGENESNTQQAVDAGLPAILGGLIKQSDTSTGAQSVFDMANRSDAGVLDNLTASLSDGKHNGLIHTGMGILSSVFGNSNAGLISSLARVAGIGQGSAGSLLGMLAPLIMGAIKQSITQNNLDATGLANRLAAQKDQVAQAMAPQLGSDLGLNDFIGDASTTKQAPTTAQTATATAKSSADDRTPGQISETVRDADGGLLGKLLPIIILGILAWLGYRYMASADVAPVSPPVEKLADSATAALPQGLEDKLRGSVSDATAVLGGITDEASAKGALNKLQGAADSVNELGLDNLPAATKGSLQQLIAPLLTGLTDALEKAYKIPGVKAIIAPVAGPMVEKLTGIST